MATYVLQKHYDNKRYKQGIKAADQVLAKHKDHGGMSSAAYTACYLPRACGMLWLNYATYTCPSLALSCLQNLWLRKA